MAVLSQGPCRRYPTSLPRQRTTRQTLPNNLVVSVNTVGLTGDFVSTLTLTYTDDPRNGRGVAENSTDPGSLARQPLVK